MLAVSQCLDWRVRWVGRWSWGLEWRLMLWSGDQHSSIMSQKLELQRKVQRCGCSPVVCESPGSKGESPKISVGACQKDQLRRAIAAARSHCVLVAELKPWFAWVGSYRVVTELWGDAYRWCKAIYEAFVNCRNICPCIVSDLHLVAASTNFICSV